MILASEVIYCSSNYSKLVNTIFNNLKDNNGICLMANKLFYYGVGGSTPEFMEFVENNFG